MHYIQLLSSISNSERTCFTKYYVKRVDGIGFFMLYEISTDLGLGLFEVV